MATGMTVSCSRCKDTYNIYDDIQVKAVGVCPNCGNVEGYKFQHPFTFDYNAGDVPPKLDDEDYYEANYCITLEEAGLENAPSGAFDQDDDLVNANLGWD